MKRFKLILLGLLTVLIFIPLTFGTTYFVGAEEPQKGNDPGPSVNDSNQVIVNKPPVFTGCAKMP